jgi:hypothetical protein
MSIEMSEPLSYPFSEITALLGENFSPSVVGVAGRAYLLDNQEGDYKRSAVQVVEQRNTTSNRDLLLLPQGIWRYMFESWHQGAGQSNLDRDDALPFRYLDSYGVDPWTKYQLSLLHDTNHIQKFTATDRVFVQVHDDYLVTIMGEKTIWNDTPTHSVDLPLGASSGKAIGFTYDGESVIVLTDTGTLYEAKNPTTVAPRKVTPPASPAAPNPIAQATFVAYVKDYLILGVGNQLWDITDPDKGVLIYTSPVVGFTWKGACEGANAIYLIGGAGDKHVVHRVAVADDGTKLQPGAVAATLPDGEIGYAIGSYLGFVFVGTDKGVRMATPSGASGDLTLGALIPTAAPVLCFEGQDRFVWYGNSQINGEFGQNQEEFPAIAVPGLGRMDLTTFTVTESTPAYANDIVAEGASGSVTSVTTWKGGRVFAVQGNGVFAEDLFRLMEAGWVTHGTVSFGVEDLKTGLYAQFKWGLLNGKVGMWAAYDSRRYTMLAENATPQSIRSGNVTLDGQQFSRTNIGVVLRREPSNDSLGPTLTRWEFRAVPTKGLASRWWLPIMNRAQIELNGVVLNRDPRAELKRLLDLVQIGGMFALQEGGVTYQVTARDYEWRPEILDDTGRSWQGTFVLVVEEIR